jgi:regulator of replication initiation timing
MLIDKKSQINLLMQDCKNYEDKIEYLTNQNEFLKNKLRESVDKNKILEEEYDKLLEENNNFRLVRNQGKVL